MRSIPYIPSQFLVALLMIGGLVPAILVADDLNPEQLKMLQDPGGWQYITISDSDNGIQTQHTCFDGQPHPQECSGTLTLAPSHTFIQSIHIHGATVQRHGTYRLEGDQLSLFDELGTRDGPYGVSVDVNEKAMMMQMNPSGGGVRLAFKLEREYRRELQKHKKANGESGSSSPTGSLSSVPGRPEQ